MGYFVFVYLHDFLAGKIQKTLITPSYLLSLFNNVCR